MKPGPAKGIRFSLQRISNVNKTWIRKPIPLKIWNFETKVFNFDIDPLIAGD